MLTVFFAKREATKLPKIISSPWLTLVRLVVRKIPNDEFFASIGIRASATAHFWPAEVQPANCLLLPLAATGADAEVDIVGGLARNNHGADGPHVVRERSPTAVADQILRAHPIDTLGNRSEG